MKMRIIIYIIILLSGIFTVSADEYMAGIKGTKEWERTDIGTSANFFVQIKNIKDKSITLLIQAVKDGHLDVKTSPMGVYLSTSHAKLISNTELPSFTIDGKNYKNIPCFKYQAIMDGQPKNIEIWQLVKDRIEYTILSIAPENKEKLVKSFISHNLTLLPLPDVSEESFMQSVEYLNSMMQLQGGVKMNDEVKMTSVRVDKERKELIRTYQFYPEVTDEDVDALTTGDATFSMLEYEVENVPLIKQAVALGYSLVVVWNDRNGELIVSLESKF